MYIGVYIGAGAALPPTRPAPAHKAAEWPSCFWPFLISFLFFVLHFSIEHSAWSCCCSRATRSDSSSSSHARRSCSRYLRQYLYFCASTASKLSSTCDSLRCCVCNSLRQYLYFCTSTASKLSNTCDSLRCFVWNSCTSSHINRFTSLCVRGKKSKKKRTYTPTHKLLLVEQLFRYQPLYFALHRGIFWDVYVCMRICISYTQISSCWHC